MTQCDILLEALRSGERLTVALALQKYGVYALSQRMGELKRMGHPVSSRTVKLPSGKYVSEYYWVGQLELNSVCSFELTT